MSSEVEPQDRGKPDPLIGETLGNRYLIESRLGEGAMGAVYRARHVKVGRPFAVKVLHARLLEDPKVAQRFEREAELAGRLHHPNVIGVVDVGVTPGGLHYMVMDFAEGPDLATLLSEAPMPPQRIIQLTRQILEGLYHAHEEGLIHRDFKPENVIVERDAHGDEVPRIVDFGIAILRDGGDSPSSQGRLTTNGLVLGTPHYMAPEQAVADPIDHRIDLFALGIVVYEMLSGKLPFDGTGAEVARANLLLEPPPISERVEFLEVDPLLEAFSRRLMAKRRASRPVTAKAARELLDLIVHDRVAAGHALGVPGSVSTRAPAVTQGVASQDEPAARPRPTELEAPRVADRLAVPQTSMGVPSAATDEVAPARSHGRIVAAIGAVAVLGLVVVLLTRGSSHDDPPAPSTPIAPVVSEITKPEPIAPVAVPLDAAVQPVEPPPVPIATHAPVAHVHPSAPASHHPVVAHSSATGTTPPTPDVRTPPVEATVTKPPAVPADASGPATPAAVATEYQAVGRQLKALQDSHGAEATAELWPRFRMIRIQDALSTPEKRAAALQTLASIARDAARIK